MPVLDLLDPRAVADLGTFASRAKVLDADGGMRLQVVGDVLAAYVCVVPSAGVTHQGVVLGLRTFAVAAEAPLDVTVPLAAITDRTRRGGSVLPVPPVWLNLLWTAVAPPRSGWSLAGEVTKVRIEEVARDGIAVVAEAGSSGTLGSLAVDDLRRRTWSAFAEPGTSADEPTTGFPAGLAFAAHTLGFGAPADLFRSGPWWRLSGPGGHALAR
ncbi:MAG: hypothetical protein ACK5MP_11035 [Nostocoides sp.]